MSNEVFSTELLSILDSRFKLREDMSPPSGPLCGENCMTRPSFETPNYFRNAAEMPFAALTHSYVSLWIQPRTIATVWVEHSVFLKCVAQHVRRCRACTDHPAQNDVRQC